MAEAESKVVWRRPFDPEARRRRRRKLLLWYALPAGVALAVGFLVGGSGAFFGLLILLGLFGLMLWGWMELVSLNERMNPEIRLEGDAFVVGKKRVNIDQAEAWTTLRFTNRTMVGGTNQTTARVTLAKLLFRVPVMRDGQRAKRADGGPAFELVGFTWPAMSEHDLDGVRRAVEPYLTAPWMEFERLRDL